MHQPGTTSLASLKAQLLNLNANNQYPFILREEGDEIIASWNIVDARWREILGKAGLKKQYELRLFFDESKKQVRYHEKSTDVEWSASPGGLKFSKSARLGKQLEFSTGSAWGAKDDGSVGKIYGYKFVSTEITDPVFEIVRNAGWQVQGILADKKKRRLAIAGVIGAALIIIVGIASILFVSLGGVKNAARAEIELLRNGQYSEAWRASAYAIQRKMTEEEFIQATKFLNFPEIEDYSFNNISVKNNVGTLSGKVTFKNGAPGRITVTMYKENEQWKLAGVSVD
ncbi:membrane protein [Citrobacter rodentium]|uniref:Membrane protein n=2 Tax=Citrobacter rodentium TaxID=67825 RepID=D2TQD4_CITRI|nr:membrane protein [Citrobacter rodentium]KIQ53263.1 membrane protein [Citrobacter rodentium]QBY27468.1 hypothetical protein E2R62_00555 [Citrobacter rodentium]UHO30622.1 DUF4019 domain-containing protein [Citrobacter rodentium NBRC 105723 = DSM 16636]CBG87600.1 putative membrane protein [Citrobacter rodentium ICC168]HAT8012755.1 hypothetical protein [Citrobacter rodentium NBRC 105723 = DSM 16636]